MPVLIISENEGQTPQGYDGMLGELAGPLKHATGFLGHMSHPTESGWRVVEIWESKEDAGRFFAENVVQKLPPGIRPKLSFFPLHSLVRP